MKAAPGVAGASSEIGFDSITWPSYVKRTKREARLTTIATKKGLFDFPRILVKLQGRSIANDWQRWQLKQKFAIVHGKIWAVDVNPSLSSSSHIPKHLGTPQSG